MKPPENVSIPLAAYGLVKDFLKTFKAEGVLVGSAARRNRLPLLIDDPLQLIPKRPVFMFLDEVSPPELPVLGMDVGERSAAEGLVRPAVASACIEGSTVLSGLRAFVRLLQTLANELPMGLAPAPGGAWLWHRGLSAPADGSRPGILQLELFILGLFLSVVRRYLGHGWQPQMLHFQAERVPVALSRRLPLSVVKTSESCLRVWIPAAELGTELHRGERCDGEEACESPPNDLVGGLRKAMIGYSADPACDFTLAFAAEISGLSERALQRRLAVHGLRFRDLLGGAMAESAKHHLNDPALTVMDVALIHGYSDASHFVRAFVHFAGITPGAYRQMTV
jgi:AraC-like DNA-binding protein